MSFEAGKQAALEGKTLADNPHTCGVTKLGNVKLTEEGIAWEAGWYSVQAPKTVTAKEEVAWRKVDPSRFRRKSNRYYQS